MSENEPFIFLLQKDDGDLSLEDVFRDLELLQKTSIVSYLDLKIDNGALYQGGHYVSAFEKGFLAVAERFKELRGALFLLPYNRGIYL